MKFLRMGFIVTLMGALTSLALGADTQKATFKVSGKADASKVARVAGVVKAAAKGDTVSVEYKPASVKASKIAQTLGNGAGLVLNVPMH